ncbi:MAG TPA: hypothetical protein QF753_02765 [Victivallales bacterium]|mgnify:CR=1 FL=1|jgi:hypothetical protein|nr:hypothetical protein [Victivallales bacterium]|tara:strand:+ start:2446 stop:3156 length:711 start_codon:yes stop_codon:yes gene_type:complete
MTTKQWLEINEALNAFDVSESTLRRYIKEHKSNKEAIQKNKNKYILNRQKLVKLYHPKKNYSNDQFDQEGQEKQKETETKKQSFNNYSERHKESNYIVKHNQNIIEELIKQKEIRTPFFRLSVFWVSLTSILIIIILGSLAYMYRSELLGNHQRELKSLSSSYKKEVETLNKNVNSLDNQLSNTKKTYTILIDNLQKNHTKLNVIQERIIMQKETELNRLRFELKSINKQTKTDTE